MCAARRRSSSVSSSARSRSSSSPDALGEKRLLGETGIVGLQRPAGGEGGRDLVAAGTVRPHRQTPDLARADGVDDADVGDRGHEQLVESLHRRREVPRAVGDLASRREHREALAVALCALAVARGDHGDGGDGDADREALGVDAFAEVVVPDAAQRDEQRRGRADRRDITRIAVQGADERGEDDEADEASDDPIDASSTARTPAMARPLTSVSARRRFTAGRTGGTGRS